MLDALIAAGVDVIRLNFSHGTQAEHAGRFHQVREAAQRADRHVAILQDLSGPKIRTGLLEGGEPIPLRAGRPARHRHRRRSSGGPGRVSTTYAPLAAGVSKGDRLLLDDGKIELVVESASAERDSHPRDRWRRARRAQGHQRAERAAAGPGMTDKDAATCASASPLGVDLVALSFVQSADDITRARALIVGGRAGRGCRSSPSSNGPKRSIVSTRFSTAADAVMVARGDLGLEIPLERVPRVQKEILRTARDRGVPVIVATQVLESMRTEPRPTRAEVSDAAGAVDGGADAIMLSGETAIGRYPGPRGRGARRIIRHAEVDAAAVDRSARRADERAITCARCATRPSRWPRGPARTPLSP